MEFYRWFGYWKIFPDQRTGPIPSSTSATFNVLEQVPAALCSSFVCWGFFFRRDNWIWLILPERWSGVVSRDATMVPAICDFSISMHQTPLLREMWVFPLRYLPSQIREDVEGVARCFPCPLAMFRLEDSNYMSQRLDHAFLIIQIMSSFSTLCFLQKLPY